MESEYDCKFEDMKKYIPFLESMIKRLESTSSMSANPRQAQLDKIRSLRDLLLDKKKRMKMENLLKCEQVLINLYAKVEQRETLPDSKKNTNPSDSDSSRMDNNSQLEIVRNKLKRVSKIQEGADTLPEIVRASDVEEGMTGRVEPALFHRRPHKKSPTLSDISSSSQEKPKSPELSSKRKYTRVLYSPGPDTRVRPADQDSSLDSVLFSRRSPKKSSSLHNKREGKKISSHKTSSKKTKDLNITLNVPEESLNSLNTKDILSRIITCNDNDVDIETLRGLRTQILSELKHTGANDDISDLILKSYAGKKSISKTKDEIEEGELSDSESEAIESIYGSLVLMDKDKTKNEVKILPEKDQPRKIQICLVINSKESELSNKVAPKPNQSIKEDCDLEMFSGVENNKTESKNEQTLKSGKPKSTDGDSSTLNVVIVDDDNSEKEHELLKVNTKVTETKNNEDRTTSEIIKTNDKAVQKKEDNVTNKDVMSKKRSEDFVDKMEANVTIKDVTSEKPSVKIIDQNETSVTNIDVSSKKASDKVVHKNEAIIANTVVGLPDSLKQNDKNSETSLQFKANFYKPLLDEENAGPLVKPKLPSVDISSIIDKKECVEIPLLNEPVIPNKPLEKDIDSQIDILQALKNEILFDNILPESSLDVVTPPLHQPKITKVSHAQGIMPKKRISIEKYKEKTTPVTLNPSLSVDILTSPLRDDNIKKQSLKLTEKECERFNFPAKIDINDDASSEDELQKESKIPSDDAYNFAPKSPDNDDTYFDGKLQPVIIPIYPVKAPVVNTKADVDMRTLPLLSPKETPLVGNTTPSSIFQKSKETKKNEINVDKSGDIADRNHSPLIDPRMRRDSNQFSKIESSSLAAMNLDKTSNSTAGTNINFASNMTPSSRGFDMTPSRLTDFDVVNSTHKHVYAPSFSLFDSRDAKDHSMSNDVCSPRNSEGTERRKSRWEESNDHESRSNISQADLNTQRSRYGDTYNPDKKSGRKNDRPVADKNDESIRGQGSMTLPLFGWSDAPSKPKPLGRPEGPIPLMMLNFGRSDCPSTPSHSFGRSDGPPALGYSFSRSDMPGTPSHPFGRTDCPMTPNHPFGRSDAPSTPIHPFGRSDGPSTPIHPFGRSDCPSTPIHPFGRSDCPATPSHPFGRSDGPPTSSNHFARMDFPGTPNHPFGMSDCPTTPSHPFGRSDCPSTPSHPFGRLECPKTPSHPFGMSDCPTTPTHPFGRIDGGVTPKYSFGRTEQNISISQQYSKDPRLNRRSESRPQRDERDNRHYKDRGFNTIGSYQMHNRSFGRSEPYTHHDRDDGGRSRSMSRTERNFEHTRSRENYFDQSNFSDKGDSYNYDNRSRRRERNIEDRYRRDKSIGRNQDSHQNLRSHSRARSISRNDNRETENDNTLSVKSHAGRSFTIDTSVNSTFQDLLKQKGLKILDQSFDSRKQRAASVGRTIASCFDKNRTIKNTSGESVTDDSDYRSRNYRRASSVGRDLQDNNESFQKVKMDFKNYQKEMAKADEKQRLSNTTSEEIRRSKKYHDNQNVKVANSTLKTGIPTYSPRNNCRDPRMRREYVDKNSHRSGRLSYDKNKHGINYTTDNLARGAVLGSGYGVKNYKIPKLKRPTNEQDDVKLVDEKIEPVETKIKKDESKSIRNTNRKDCSDENKDVKEGSPRRRLTRSSKKYKNVSTKTDSIEIRKPKRAVIYDSSSDSETTNKDSVGSNVLTSEDEKSRKIKYSESNQNEQSRQESNANDTDENEIFFDNVVSDPVIDNINALIADLDNHIDNSKTESSEHFKDITFEDDLSNMSNLGNICLSKENTFDALFNKDINVQKKVLDEPQDENLIGEDVSCIDTFSKTLHENVDEVHSRLPIDSHESNNSEVDKSQVDNLTPLITNYEKLTDERNVTEAVLQNVDDNKTNPSNDAIVSTTDNDKEISNNTLQKEIMKPPESNDVNYETSAADSTNEITNDKTKEHNAPDSTNEVHNEMNSFVSSSLSSADVPTKDFIDPNLPHQSAVPPLDSIGGLLSILQDKSKIHQLLSMLGEQSGDNNKIKRKLEKLSEIVSDDEESELNKTANKDGDVNLTSENCTLEVSSPIADEKSNTQIHANEEVVSTEVENAEQPIDEVATAKIDAEETVDPEQPLMKNDEEKKDDIVVAKKGKWPRKGKGRFAKAKKQHVTPTATGQDVKSPPVKKPSRELIKLREDIKEMFLTDEMLNTTGIRMCRLAKLVDEKSSNKKEDTTLDPKPVVIIEKFKDQDKLEESVVVERPTKKKTSPKTKRKASLSEDLTNEESKVANPKSKAVKNIAVPKSKTKSLSKQDNIDPYEFETDSVDTSTVKGSESEAASDSETNSLASSKSFGSSEVLADLHKKTKRKRRGKGWQTGIIRPKYKKKKQVKGTETSLDVDSVNVHRNITIPDNECFIDKFYCFEKNVTFYSCRLCEYTGDDIILHYKKHHPHTEIPLSRMNPVTAKEAIEQCQEVNFPAISKISTDRYVCRFCFKEFSKSKAVLECFFWHVVSMHTGEYKQSCSECSNDTCYFNLDIPPPPKDNVGQLIGYLCGKCNFTQVSLENLKTHVIGRHNDEQTDVYTINLAVMTKKTLKTLAKHQSTIAPRVLRSSRPNQSIGEATDDHNEIADNSTVTEPVSQKEERIVTIKTEKKGFVTSMQDKIAFESEENITASDLGLSDHDNSLEIKKENLENEDTEGASHSTGTEEPEIPENSEIQLEATINQSALPDDIMAHSHFKICYKESGAKEYVCCINGIENHYKTTLLISMKKHVQTKHDERWDGYCVLCKVIVTPQGAFDFKDCLQHFLDKHLDEFPVLERATEVCNDDSPTINSSAVTAEVPKPYINVRPLNQLISSPVETEITNDSTIQFPKIQSVVSLGAHVDLPRSSPSYPSVLCTETPEEKQYRYEEWQAEVMSKKHRVVLNAMMSEEKLVKVFKCTGKFCSFTTDNAENALLHATTHQRIGGEGALNCSYCDFDAANNGIDLVMHVFKAHGKCPYLCKLCFYRATSSHLVSSHISRLHSERHSFDAILRTTTISAPVGDEDNFMTREEAVPYYVCGHPSSESEADGCKFRTYTPGQFGEHLARHTPPYPCNMCQTSLSSVSELVHHMKIHGLRLYQCTSCVFGADNESEMLAHASARHPDRLPQAYLRVVTNKDGSTEFRVLPRVLLNKLKAPSRDVISVDIDNPVREAERSIALEKLIGHTESVTSIEPIQSTNDTSDDDVATDTGIVDDSEVLLTENTDQEPEPPAFLPPPDPPSRRKSNPASTAAEIKHSSLDENVSLVVKTEPGVKKNTSTETVIYCLDSDEEESTSRVIDLSDDDLISTPTASTSKVQEDTSDYIKVTLDTLFRCPKCNCTNRNLTGFKRHANMCMASMAPMTNVQCPHVKCTRKLNGLSEIADHYLKDHADRRVTMYACGVCKAKFKTAKFTKKHMKEIHRSSNFTVNSLMTIQGDNNVYTINETSKSTTLKRKSSLDAVKQKRYGPQDIDQLPINPILENLVYCSLCEFNTKVRLNMVRHLQLHAEQQPAPQTAPVNPVPHLETNERYFDRMVNLASSSIATRAPDKQTRADMPSGTPAIDITRYPKYVPDRIRYTCGTKNCSYISVDEGMLRIHWETLHSNTSDYLCVHCPPHQRLDHTKPLTAARIIGHLKMHEEDLYACSACSYYHFKRVAVEKHLQKCPQMHKEGHIMVVRECGVTPTPTPTPTPAPSSSAPTMDLKPWQCGLCSFKSMLRPEVATHCFKIHQSKMQFKCNYCPFRTSVVENVTKHQTNAHQDKTEDVFYYYYREGSIPDDEDGTPRWMRQKQKSGISEPVVKSEIPEPSTSQCAVAPVTPTPVPVNLNLVKQEVEDTETSDAEMGIEELCKRFGGFCEPTGTMYKCPLCTAVTEDKAEAMQSHLYEELKYRKWGCSVCSYKAFHKTGLNEHIKSEHYGQFRQPIELPADVNVEKWVAGLLEHQTNIIERNRLNPTADETPSTSKGLDTEVDEANLEELEQAFGAFGTPRDSLFCCPKCSCTLNDERVMKEHLESELTKIRWCCSNCSFMSHTYHEAQFHCKSVHAGESARPREALRSADKRNAWVHAVLHTQRHSMKTTPPGSHNQTAADKLTDLPDPNDNSLLVVRYEERVPTPETVNRRKRSAPVDSDEEKLVIDEAEPSTAKKSQKLKECPYCDFKTKWNNALREHVLRHYNLKPFKCKLCDFPGYRAMILKHIERFHPGHPFRMEATPVPTEPPQILVLPKPNTKKVSVVEEDDTQICLRCGKTVFQKDLLTHKHDDVVPEFGKKGEVVVKCCICFVLRLDVPSLQEHHNACHPGVPVNYAYFKLHCDSLECYYCWYCNNRFSYLRDLRSHHRATHSGMLLKYTTGLPQIAEEESATKRKNEDEIIEASAKKVARKSTTKLPHNTVAKKSTTKLPYNVNDDVNKKNEGFSYYGTKPPPLDKYANVTTLMPFCNTLVPFTIKKLSEIIKIEPVVLVTDDRK